MITQNANPAGLAKGDKVTVPPGAKSWYGWSVSNDCDWVVDSIGPNGLTVIVNPATGYAVDIAAAVLVKD